MVRKDHWRSLVQPSAPIKTIANTGSRHLSFGDLQEQRHHPAHPPPVTPPVTWPEPKAASWHKKMGESCLTNKTRLQREEYEG